MKPLYYFIILLMVGCTKTSPLHHTRWSGNSVRPTVSTQNSLIIGKNVQSMAEVVVLREQVFEDVPVQGTYIKTINSNNETVFESSATVDRPSPKSLRKAQELKDNIFNIWLKFLKKHPDYKNWPVEEPPSVFFKAEDLTPYVRVILKNQKSFRLHEIIFNSDIEITAENIVGSQLNDLAEVDALAYPQGPIKSDLSEVKILRDLKFEGLKNLDVQIDTESPSKIKKDQDLEIPPNDDRFEQVQAFYFSNKFLTWFKENLGIDVGTNVSIVTQVGFPEKTNASFYFHEKIRLGSGDDITFSKIYLDPSIVMHETAHFVIDRIARLPFTGEGGSLNEGFADVFTTFFLGSPRLGEVAYKKAPFVRTVETKVLLSEKNGKLYHDSLIVSSFFWNLKSFIGKEETLKLCVKVLNRLSAYSNLDDFTVTLKEQVNDLPDEQKKKATQLMQEMGFM